MDWTFLKSKQQKWAMITLVATSILTNQSVLADAAAIDIPQISPATIKVDATLDEPAWQNAISIDINNITYPEENVTASVKTVGKMFEDGETLYIGFIAQDNNPEKIRAFLRDRDSNNIWNDDIIGIKLDTYGDSKLAYQFWVNALGVQVDSIENAVTRDESAAWDAIWDSAGRVTDEGYIVEIALPLRILNFNDKLDRQNWRVELVRFFPRGTRQRISNMTIDPNNDCKVCQMGELRGFKGAKQGNNLTVVPTVTLGGNQSRDIEADPVTDWESESNTDVGLDIRWGITPDISLNATFNPDFSQIEADVAQLSINNTFALFFPEKRAFFLDNIDYFATPLDLVYTRNINSPDHGAKLTGRIKEHSFGIFAANDESTSLLMPGNLGSSIASIEEESQNAVLRYRYDPNKNLSMGWIGTFRQTTDDSSDYHNYVHGFDVKYKMTDKDDLSAQILSSDTQYPQDLHLDFFDQQANEECEELNCQYNEQTLRSLGDDKLTDKAYTIRYDHRERDWDMVAQYQSFGKDFRADLGFINVVDWNKFVIGGNRIWRDDNSNWWQRIRFGGDWDITHNDDGELLEKEAQVWLNIEATNQSNININYTDRDRVGTRWQGNTIAIDGNSDLFKEKVIYSYWSTQLKSNLSVSTNIDFGDEVDFANNRVGDMLFVRPTITWNPNKHITLRTRYTHKTLEADGADVFTAKLWDTRLTYQFSVRSFIRLALIYSDIERNQANYIDEITERSKNLSSQLLYSYKINPQTLFFVGYSDSAYANDEINDIKKDNRTIFMKFSYAWLQ